MKRLIVIVMCGLTVPMLHAASLNLDTTNSGSINGAFFERTGPQPFGTGVVRSFLRYEENGNGDGIEQGYNSDYRAQGSPKVEFDEKTDPNFNRSVLLSDISKVDDGRYEFFLDTNEPNNKPNTVGISLDSLQIFLSTTGSATGFSGFGGNAYKVWDLDGGSAGDSEVLLSDFNHGSGQADLRVLIPITPDPTHPYLILYAKQGVHQSADFAGQVDAGFEEWTHLLAGEVTPPGPPVPLPAAAWSGLGMLGVLGLGVGRRKLVEMLRH